MSVVAIEPVDRDAYIGNAVGICFFLALVNLAAVAANPWWKRMCACTALNDGRNLKGWRHYKTWPPPWWQCGCKCSDEEGGHNNPAREVGGRRVGQDGQDDTSFWGWQGLDARHLTDGFLGPWGTLVLRTLELILFLFQMIFQARAPPDVTVNEDHQGIRPEWLTYLTNWTFLLFGLQAALGLGLTVVDLCWTTCCVDLERSTSEYHHAPKIGSHVNQPHLQSTHPTSSAQLPGAATTSLRLSQDSSSSSSNGACTKPQAAPRDSELRMIKSPVLAAMPPPPSIPTPPPSASPLPEISIDQPASGARGHTVQGPVGEGQMYPEVRQPDHISEQHHRRHRQRLHWIYLFTPWIDHESSPLRPLNFLEKTYLLLYQTSFVSTIIVTIFFWAALSDEEVKAGSVLRHGAQAYAMLLDVCVCRMPVVAFHIIVMFWYGTIYAIFLFIYQIQEWRYELVGWDDRLSPLAYVVLFIVIVILYIIMFAIALIRDWLVCKYQEYLKRV